MSKEAGTEQDRDQGDEGVAEKLGKENEGLKAMLARYNNDALATAAELYSQTYGLREDRRNLRKQVEELKAKVPQENSVVLTAEEAKAWETYRELGKPDEIRTSLDNAKKDRRAALASRAASTHGYNPEVLERLLADNAEIIEGDKGEDGKPVYKVKVGDTTKTLSELAESDWKPFMKSLLDNGKPEGRPAVGQPGGARESGKADYISDYVSKVQPEANKS